LVSSSPAGWKTPEPGAAGLARQRPARDESELKEGLTVQITMTARFSLSAWNGATLVGVAMTGNPVARAFMGRGIVEVNRLCVRRDMPAALRWNAASLLYGRAAREAERRGFQRIITYTRADEAGTSLHAAGWVQEASVRGRGWHNAGRSRSNTNAFIDKVRWSRTLRPRASLSGKAGLPHVPAPDLMQAAGSGVGHPGLTLECQCS